MVKKILGKHLLVVVGIQTWFSLFTMTIISMERVVCWVDIKMAPSLVCLSIERLLNLKL